MKSNDVIKTGKRKMGTNMEKKIESSVGKDTTEI